MSIARVRLVSLCVLAFWAVAPAVGSAFPELRSSAPRAFLSVDTQQSADDADDIADFLYRLTSPYNRTSRLFETVYGVRPRFVGSGNAEYLGVISTILEAWLPRTPCGLPGCSDRPFARAGDALLIALDDANRLLEFWKVLPRDSRLRLAEALREYGIGLDDGLNRDELRRFSDNHDRVQLISKETVDASIAHMSSVIPQRLTELVSFWGALLNDIRMESVDKSQKYLAGIPATRVASGLLVGEMGNDGATVFIPPHYAYSVLDLDKALIHQIGALWGLDHTTNGELEDVFVRWYESGPQARQRVVVLPVPLKTKIEAEIGKRSTDRH